MTALALAIEAAVGYPDRLYRHIGHPVTWIGRFIDRLDHAFNREEHDTWRRRVFGVFALVALLLVTGANGWALQHLLGGGLLGFLIFAVLAATLPAQRSLNDHVIAVADGLDRGLDEGRRAVSMIVGRNPEHLDEAGVARAAIESLAENYSDGVVAPSFWMAVGGLPGALLYKAANTADSMLGHRTPRHEAFGWASARFDDLINLPASRLAALTLVMGATVTPGASPKAAIRAVVRDARHHRSPNAGWPEAAMAGALGLKLAGARVYGETLVDDAFMGDGRRDATSADIRRALIVYRRACLIQWLVIAGLAGFFIAQA